jgi:hypothetical protein
MGEMREKGCDATVLKMRGIRKAAAYSEACRSGYTLSGASTPHAILTAAASDCGEATNGKSVAEAGGPMMPRRASTCRRLSLPALALSRPMPGAFALSSKLRYGLPMLAGACSPQGPGSKH